MAPELGNPVFEQSAKDELIIRTIRYGRKGTAMPAFQRPDAPVLADQDIADVLSFLRSLVPPKPTALSQNEILSVPFGVQP